MRKPDYYQTPLRSRRDIVGFIVNATHQRDSAPFCFNVKVYGVNLEFEHLLDLYREYEGDPIFTHNDDWLKAAKEQFDESEEDLFDWGIEGARDLVTDSDCFNHLWDGTPVDVEYSFEGRSGGWLSLNRFDGVDFTTTTDEDYDTLLMEQDYAWLRRLYQLIVMLKHDLRREAVQAEVEHHAAFDLFVNACASIPQPNERQLKLEFAS